MVHIREGVDPLVKQPPPHRRLPPTPHTLNTNPNRIKIKNKNYGN